MSRLHKAYYKADTQIPTKIYNNDHSLNMDWDKMDKLDTVDNSYHMGTDSFYLDRNGGSVS